MTRFHSNIVRKSQSSGKKGRNTAETRTEKSASVLITFVDPLTVGISRRGNAHMHIIIYTHYFK